MPTTDPSTVPPLFAFGTLRDHETLALVLGRRPPPTLDAVLPDHAARTVVDEVYPMLVPATGDSATGVLVEGLQQEDWQRLQWFEGAAYRRVQLQVNCGGTERMAQVFDAGGRLSASDEAWSLAAWCATHKAQILLRAAQWMAAYDGEASVPPTLPWGAGPFHDDSTSDPA